MKIFISHSKKDNKIVQKIVEFLKYYDVDHFADTDQIKFGSEVQKKINQGLESSNIFLLVWSKNAKDSEWVDAEKDGATEYDNDRLLKIVFRLDDTKLGIPFSKFERKKITFKNIESEIKQIIYELGDFFSQLKLFKEKVIRDYENFNENKKYNPVISDFKKFDGKNLYVPQQCEFLDGLHAGNNVSDYCLNHLKNKSGTLVIVGNYGNGKSGLCHNLMYELCNDFSNDIIPIFIPLGDFKQYSENEKTVLAEIISFLQDTYKFNIEEKTLVEFIKSKKIRFIFDALDELSPKLDSTVAQQNLNYIYNSALETPTIITSRHTYLAGGIPKDLIKHKMALKILDFDEEEVKEFLKLKFEENKLIISKVHDKIYSNKKLTEIVSKPLFLNIFCDKFEEIKDKFVNQALLFRTLTVGWFQHDLSKPNQIIIKEKFSKKEISHRASERLAIQEFSTKTSVTIEDIEKLIADEFDFKKAELKKESKTYIRYARDSTFLSVEENDSFSFLLRPFLEYFVASRIVREINEYDEKKQFQSLLLDVTPEILEFVTSIIEADWLVNTQIFNEIKIQKKSPLNFKLNKVENIFKILNEHRKDSPRPRLTNAIKILHMINQIPPDINLDNLDLAGLTANNLNLNNASLKKTDLSNSKLSDSNIVHSNLTEADLADSVLENTNFAHSIMNKAKLIKSDLSRANLNAVQLIGAHMENADAKRSNLCGAILNDTHLEETDFTEANLVAVDFTNSTMFKTKFIKSNLTNADFSDSTMMQSDLTNANLSETILVRVKGLPISTEEAKRRGARI